MKKLQLIFTGMACFILGCLFILVTNKCNLQKTFTGDFSEVRESGYQYINPLLECEYVDNLGNTELAGLKTGVEKILERYNDLEVGVYYRDLTNGPWFGINEDLPFAPQSLLKLPTAFAYYKIAENNPQILKTKIVYDQTLSNTNIGENLQLNEEYSVEFLIQRMLKLSDNAAFNLLVAHLANETILKVHQDLGIAYPEEVTPDDFVSVKTYASIFRVLYNSSYLSRKYSEQILGFLIESKYQDGLVAGVPEEVKVAHKYGIRNSDDSSVKSQLHDCGIVYHPQKPYILCAMSKGEDKDRLTEVIQKVSKLVYGEVSGE